MNDPRKIRLFLDSNVITLGFVSAWGLDKGILSLCAARVCKLVLADAVREEVERNLLKHAEQLPPPDGELMLERYRRLLQLCDPELAPYPDPAAIVSNRHLSRHLADVPVLLSAMAAKPDWLLTNNTKHFTVSVAKQTNLRIATPVEFFRMLATYLGQA